MAKTINKGIDTTNETVLAVSVPGIDFGTDFRTKVSTTGEVKVINTTSPIDRPETIRFAYQEVADIYKNTDIDTSVMAASHKGVQILVQVSDVYSILDDADATYRVDLPISAHMVIKVPACEYLTDSDILLFANRLVGCLYDNQAVDATRIKALLRGSLEPSTM